MPKSKKHPKDMTTEELANHIFGPKLYKKLKDIAHEKDDKPEPPQSPQDQSTR